MIKKVLTRGVPAIALIVFLVFQLSCRRQENVVRFGAILSLTGPAAPYGQDNRHGIELAQEVINERGGIRGKKVTVDIQDSAGDPAQAVLLAQRFASDPSITAIVGPTRTGSTVAVAKLLPNLGIVGMSVGSTGDWANASGGSFNPWTFRSTRVDTTLVGPLLQTVRDKFSVKRIAMIYTANDDWSMSVKKVYESKASELGLQLVAEESQMAGDTDRSAQLTKIKGLHPDALIINVLSSDAPTIADQARHIGLTARFLGTAGFTNPSTWKLAGPGVLDGTILADNFYPDSPKRAVHEFVDRYRQRFGGDPPAYAAYAYDGLMLLANACSAAADPCDRKAIRDALATTHNYEGVLGTLTYNGSGDAIKTPIILEIRNGKYALLN